MRFEQDQVFIDPYQDKQAITDLMLALVVGTESRQTAGKADSLLHGIIEGILAGYCSEALFKGTELKLPVSVLPDCAQTIEDFAATETAQKMGLAADELRASAAQLYKATETVLQLSSHHLD